VRFLDYEIELGLVMRAPLPVGTAGEEQDLDCTRTRTDMSVHQARALPRPARLQTLDRVSA
jgi:hypothetical protein